LLEKTSNENIRKKLSKNKKKKLIKTKYKREKFVSDLSLISSIIIINKNKTATAPT
jgi:hypothetical protein